MPLAEEIDAQTRARALFERGKLGAAIAVLTVGVRHRPNSGHLWLLRAVVHHSQGKWSTALDDIETAMTLIALPVSGQLVLGDCYSHTARIDLALTAYEHLLQLEGAPRCLYAGLYSGFQRCGRRDLALEACRAAVQADPDDHAAYFAMAHCMAALGHSATYVAAAISKAVRIAPGKPSYRLSLAMQLVRGGRPDEAYRHLSAVPIEHLSGLACVCSARSLLQLCVWFGDAKRSGLLCQCINRLCRGSRGEASRKIEKSL